MKLRIRDQAITVADRQLPSKDEADVCEVARDMELEGRLDDARRCLEQAPNRLARGCPACGAKPGDECRDPAPAEPVNGCLPNTSYTAMLSQSYQWRPMLVPHHARLVGHLDAGPLFTAQHEACTGCQCEIDPETCHCGEAVDSHNEGSGHSPVPMGCRCHESRPDDPMLTGEIEP